MDERQKELEEIQRKIERRIRGDSSGKDKAMYVGLLVFAGFAVLGVCVVLCITIANLKLDEKAEKGFDFLLEEIEYHQSLGDLESVEVKQLRETRELKNEVKKLREEVKRPAPSSP